MKFVNLLILTYILFFNVNLVLADGDNILLDKVEVVSRLADKGPGKEPVSTGKARELKRPKVVAVEKGPASLKTISKGFIEIKVPDQQRTVLINDYYKNDSLSTRATNVLLAGALVFLLGGLWFLKLPSLLRLFARLKGGVLIQLAHH